MPLYDLKEDEAKLIIQVLNNFIIQADKKGRQAFDAQTDEIIKKLEKPINAIGKPKVVESPKNFEEKII